MANISFDANYYYEQKLNQLQEQDSEQYADWSVADVALSFNENGLTAEEHYEQYGAAEGLNPSAEFDTQAYLSAKLGQLQEQDSEQYADWTVEDVAQAFEDNGLSPLAHFNQFGQDEGLEAVPAGDNTSGLTEDLATLLELDELPAEYTVTDASVDLGALAVADVTTSLEKAQAIVDGAANADELELDATYSVEDTLSNLLAAETLPESYELDASAPRIDNNATVADATAARDIIAGASNAADIAVGDVYVWKVEDSAANIVAAIEDGAVTGAGEVRVSFEEGDQLTVEQAEALNGLENLVGELPPVDAEGALTEALSDLADAQQAEVDFREGLDDLDVNADGEIDVEGSADVEAGEASADDVKDFYANASTAMGNADNTDISNFENRSASIQDAAIADKQAELEESVQDATDAAEGDMTSLLNAVEARQEAYADQAKAQAEAQEAHDDEVTAFEAVNQGDLGGDTVEESADSLYFSGEAFGVLSADGDGGLEIAEGDEVATLVDGEWVFEEGKTELKGLSDLYAQAQALETEDNALSTARAAVEDAVKNVIVQENDVHSVAALNDAVNFTGGEATVKLDATNVTVYETEADSEATGQDDAVAEEFTVTFTGTASTSADDTVEFDGESITLGQGDNANAITTSIAGGNYSNWSAADNGDGSVTFTANEAGDIEDVTTGDFSITNNGDGSVAVDSITIDTDGSDETVAANPTDLDAAAPDAADLAEAIQTLANFEELTATFEESRDLNNQLDSLEGDIEDATAAIENDPDNEDAPGLGVTLADFTDGAQGTSDNEVFLFEDSTDTDVAIGNFGAGGEDKIFFGEGYSLVALGDDAITDNVGDANAQEIFWEQAGNAVNLYVEAETFGGNSAGDADVTQVTLTGVDGADISDNLGNGFLSAGEVA